MPESRLKLPPTLAFVLAGGRVIIRRNSKIGRNCCIGPGMNLPAAGIDELGDGETFDEGMRR
jgi:hypothetical protein